MAAHAQRLVDTSNRFKNHSIARPSTSPCGIWITHGGASLKKPTASHRYTGGSWPSRIRITAQH